MSCSELETGLQSPTPPPSPRAVPLCRQDRNIYNSTTCKIIKALRTREIERILSLSGTFQRARNPHPRHSRRARSLDSHFRILENQAVFRFHAQPLGRGEE